MPCALFGKTVILSYGGFCGEFGGEIWWGELAIVGAMGAIFRRD